MYFSLACGYWSQLIYTSMQMTQRCFYETGLGGLISITVHALPVSPQREHKHFRSSIPRCIFCCGFSGYHRFQPDCLHRTVGLFWCGSLLVWRIVRLPRAQLLGDNLKTSNSDINFLWIQNILTTASNVLTVPLLLSVSLLQLISSYMFMPLSLMMGVSWEDCFIVADLIGIKTFINEFVAYQKLSVLIKRRKAGGPEYVNNIKQYISVSVARNNSCSHSYFCSGGWDVFLCSFASIWEYTSSLMWKINQVSHF